MADEIVLVVPETLLGNMLISTFALISLFWTGCLRLWRWARRKLFLMLGLIQLFFSEFTLSGLFISFLLTSCLIFLILLKRWWFMIYNLLSLFFMLGWFWFWAPLLFFFAVLIFTVWVFRAFVWFYLLFMVSPLFHNDFGLCIWRFVYCVLHLCKEIFGVWFWERKQSFRTYVFFFGRIIIWWLCFLKLYFLVLFFVYSHQWPVF